MEKKHHKKKINLKIWIPVAAVLLIIIVSTVMLLSSSTTVAALNIEEGNVQVDTGKGWVAALDGMELSQDDKVKTLDGKAVLVLYESILVEMDENTEVSISELSKDNTKIKQESGSTWNKFAAITGVQNFEVETPNTVATVRGTDFWVDMESVGVTDGLVDVKMDNKLFKVGQGRKAVRNNTSPYLKDLDEKDIAKAMLKKQIIVKHLEKLREKEIYKHQNTYNLIKRIKGWTDADINRYITKLDNGELDENQLKSSTILPAASIDKFAKITTEIKRQKADIETLKQKRVALGEKTIDTLSTKEDVVVKPRELSRNLNQKPVIADVQSDQPLEPDLNTLK